jgi:hypothetical protein
MPKSRTPSERSQQARMAAHVLHSKHDSEKLTRSARAKFAERFVNEVDPDRLLPERERNRRAEQARKAYFTGLALKSARARRARGTDA